MQNHNFKLYNFCDEDVSKVDAYFEHFMALFLLILFLLNISHYGKTSVLALLIGIDNTFNVSFFTSLISQPEKILTCLFLKGLSYPLKNHGTQGF